MPTLNHTCWLAVCVGLVLAGCAQRRPETFPDADIVYQSSKFRSPSIGFVNADGSNNHVLPLDFYPAKPGWSDDGKTLYFLQIRGDSGALGLIYGGSISYWREGAAVHTCANSEWEGILGLAPTPDSRQVILTKNTQSVVLADVDECRELQVYLELETDHMYPAIPSVSSDGQLVVYSIDEYRIELLDNHRDQITQIGSGINPALSPDNLWIAYVQLDGIYISAIDGSRQRRLVDYSAKDRSFSQFEAAPPAPRWSPDGQWLVYHKCVALPGACTAPAEFSIFKVNVATGEEVKIVDEGAYPYWRPR